MVSGFRLWPMMTGLCQLVLMRGGHNAAMTGRRTFLQTGLAAALLPAARAADAAPLPTNFPAKLQEALAKSLDDPKVAAKLAPVLLDVGFTWDAPAQPAAGFQTIVAYAFGNRPATAGSTTPLPGPMNETLAKAVIEAQRKSGASAIYAQWEIASFLTEQKGIGKVVAINPVVAADGSVKYLSTDGVAEAIVTMVVDARPGDLLDPRYVRAVGADSGDDDCAAEGQELGSGVLRNGSYTIRLRPTHPRKRREDGWGTRAGEAGRDL